MGISDAFKLCCGEGVAVSRKPKISDIFCLAAYLLVTIKVCINFPLIKMNILFVVFSCKTGLGLLAVSVREKCKCHTFCSCFVFAKEKDSFSHFKRKNHFYSHSFPENVVNCFLEINEYIKWHVHLIEQSNLYFSLRKLGSICVLGARTPRSRGICISYAIPDNQNIWSPRFNLTPLFLTLLLPPSPTPSGECGMGNGACGSL